MEDILGDQPVSGLSPHYLEAQLHLACDDGKSRSFTEDERHAAWRFVMQSEMDAVKKNRTWELAGLPCCHRAITLKWVFKLKRDEAGAIVKAQGSLGGMRFRAAGGDQLRQYLRPRGTNRIRATPLCASCLGRLVCSSHGRQVGVS
jgi:hypothetical protein